MLTLFLQLIDRLIQFQTRHEYASRNIFTDFCMPVKEVIDALYEDYMESFRRYQKSLEDETAPFSSGHGIVEEMAADNFYSEGLRQKLRSMRRFKDGEMPEELVEFFDSAAWFCFGRNDIPASKIATARGDPQSSYLTEEELSWLASDGLRQRVPLDDPIGYLRGQWQRGTQIHRAPSAISILELETWPLDSAEKRSLAKRIVAESVYKLNVRYGRVLHAYEEAKKTLLLPR